MATFNGLKEQLKMIGFNLEQLQAGKITSTINIIAPISGNITKINAVIGKFIDPAEVMFEIINTDHMHIELNVYEKDVLHIKEGQKILFNIPGQGRKNEYTGEMHLVGKSFTNEDRTVQVHAHFDDRKTSFLPGMYVVAVILTGDERVTALPEEAVVQEAGDAYIFVKTNGNPEETSFKKIEILVGKSSNGWIEVKPMESLNPQDSVVLNGTYYLNAELARTL